MMLPAKYRWLEQESAPKILVEALRLYGTKEIGGTEHNKIILSWAEEIGGWISRFYNKDEIPWCGLFVGICAKRAGFPFTQEMLSAKAWANWGTHVVVAKLGDVLVFERDGGGHVAIYVGEDKDCYHVLGGNQANQVNITRIKKDRLLAIRRCPWHISQPKNIRRIILSPEGAISTNEG